MPFPIYEVDPKFVQAGRKKKTLEIKTKSSDFPNPHYSSPAQSRVDRRREGDDGATQSPSRLKPEDP